MAATQAKEALSLSDLNILASNPPQYPEKPNEDKQEPLVLYISRVPGTRDIILSPFKPSEKNVGSEDVASSLYYIHLELPSHELVAPTPFRNDETGSTSDGSASAMAIPRKPLPENARPVTPDSASSSKMNLAAPVPDGRQRGASMTSLDGFRPALSSSLATESYIPTSESDDLNRPRPIPPGLQAPPARKPVGPRAMVPSMAISDSSPTAPTGGRFRSDSAASAMREMRDSRHSYASRSPSPRKRSVVSVAPGEPFALTLIRRDPGTGSQWNVGRVTSRQLDPPVEDEEQSSGLLKTGSPPDGVSTTSPPININLENSGYAKFRRLPRRRSLEAAGLSVLAANAVDDDSTVPETGVFARQLQMGYTKSLMSNLKDKFQKLEEQISKKGHGRNGSDSSQEMTKEPTTTAIGQPGPGMKPRGYTFTSPWDGKCDFRTGNGGRSVRCYHTPHDSQNLSYNQLLEEQGINLPRSSATALSELRFNLPSTELLVHSEHDGANGESKLRGHFAKLLRPSSGHHDADDDEDGAMSPFDMNIGGERAGGGNRGNRAKLGKLIIFHDGLKMLDLLVAANVGYVLTVPVLRLGVRTSGNMSKDDAAKKSNDDLQDLFDQLAGILGQITNKADIVTTRGEFQTILNEFKGLPNEVLSTIKVLLPMPGALPAFNSIVQSVLNLLSKFLIGFTGAVGTTLVPPLLAALSPLLVGLGVGLVGPLLTAIAGLVAGIAPPTGPI
ncbi:hypothetical protein NLG97_g7509 [Lecanicillium saksenae]|uniref:Uncharacterized protein n=1 Tax=Lecanicillium saksenae TaxID=468837 RepID=A0ACC1QNA6_9HYPO|nr:hypothetical protein NLG97_g7509 [Lecanicillium saksenae]